MNNNHFHNNFRTLRWADGLLEMLDQRLDAGIDVGGFEHVGADELGQIPYRLHRHRLVEQLQGRRVSDPQAPPEVGAVLAETVVHRRVPLAQVPARRAIRDRGATRASR
mgnify:CR=1 FL=1